MCREDVLCHPNDRHPMTTINGDPYPLPYPQQLISITILHTITATMTLIIMLATVTIVTIIHTHDSWERPDDQHDLTLTLNPKP